MSTTWLVDTTITQPQHLLFFYGSNTVAIGNCKNTVDVWAIWQIRTRIAFNCSCKVNKRNARVKDGLTHSGLASSYVCCAHSDSLQISSTLWNQIMFWTLMFIKRWHFRSLDVPILTLTPSSAIFDPRKSAEVGNPLTFWRNSDPDTGGGKKPKNRHVGTLLWTNKWWHLHPDCFDSFTICCRNLILNSKTISIHE